VSARLGRDPLGPEFKLIDRLADRLPAPEVLPDAVRAGLRLGIGDDAAVWRLPDGNLGLLTIDTVVEGVHAYPHERPEDVGARALTAAVSDVAAMGGTPFFAVVALQAPRRGSDETLERLYDGLAEEARALGVAVVGGDVVDTPGPLAFSIAVYGTCPDGRLWPRGGARAGDVLAVTGRLGGSRAGLELIGDPDYPPRSDWEQRLAERHLRPRARVAAARALQARGGVHGAQDISDGLSSELWHLALASEVGLRIEAAAVPLHPDLERYLEARAAAGGERLDPVGYALDSGEEYELLLALEATHPALAEPDLGGEGPLTVIGAVTAGPPEVILVEAGGPRRLLPGGWSHRGADGGKA
jgi:thiamine-monophosphate kinase